MSELIDKIFGPTMPALKKNLDLRYTRNEALVSNITNAETPGYRAVDLNFAGELERAFYPSANTTLQKTNAKHLSARKEGGAHLVSDLSGATKPDGNNVDIDIQMGQLALNSGKYQSTASLVRKKIQIVRQAIRMSMR